MPCVSVFVLDNGLSSQNQDYLPNRFVAQKEAVREMVSKILGNDPESLVGIIPLSRKEKNYILTPTKSRKYLNNYLHSIVLLKDQDYYPSFFQAERSLSISQFSTLNLYVFLSSPVECVEEVLGSLYSIAAKGINIRVICFGDCIEIADILEKGILFTNFKCRVIRPEEDFNSASVSFFNSDNSAEDAYMEECLRRSLIEK